MIIELQLAIDNFLHGIRNELRSRPICFVKEIKLDTATVVLDYFEITDDTKLESISQSVQVIEKGAIQTLNGSAVLATQEIVAHFVSISDLQVNGPLATPPSDNPLFRQSVKVRFALTATLPDGRPHLHFEYYPPAEVGAAEALLHDAGQQIDTALAGFSGSVPLNLSEVDLLAATPGMLFTNAGIVVANGVFVLRLEWGTDPGTANAWSSFFSGAVPSRLNDKSWALFIDKRIMLRIAQDLISKPVANFRRSGPPEVEWASNGRGIHATQSGVLPDAGPLNSDVNVTVSLQVDFSVPSVDLLVVDLFGSASGEVSGLIGTVMDFVGISADPSGALPSGGGGWTKTGDTSYQRKEYVQLTDSLLGHLALEVVAPDPNGLHLLGSVRQTSIIRAKLEATLQPFQWGVHGSCQAGKTISCLGSVGLTNTGTAPLVVCEARVLSDPNKMYPVSVETTDSPSSQFATAVVVKFNFDPGPHYYPCLLLVKTNGGARAVSLGAPVLLSDTQQGGLQAELEYEIVNCHAISAFGGIKEHPEWIPDPPNERTRPDHPDEGTLHLSQVLVSGLSEGEQIMILDGEDRVLGTGLAGENGVAYVRSVGAALPGSRESTILRTGVPNEISENVAEETHSNRRLQIRQTLLDHVAELPSGTEPVTLLAGRYNNKPVLIVVGGSRGRIYDLRIPSRPVLVDSFNMTDLASANLDLAQSDVPMEFGDSSHGPTYMQNHGVLVGDVFVHSDNTNVKIYSPRQVP